MRRFITCATISASHSTIPARHSAMLQLTCETLGPVSSPAPPFPDRTQAEATTISRLRSLPMRLLRTGSGRRQLQPLG